MEKQKFDVYGMTCSACSARVEKVVRGLDGIKDVSVNLLTNSMVAEWSSPLNAETIIKAIREAGYDASVYGQSEKRKKVNPTLVLLIRLIVSAVLLVPLMYVSMGHLMFGWYLPEKFANNPLAIAGYELAFSFIIICINYKFFVSGAKSLLKRAPNMDTLVSMGSGISFIYSIALMIKAGVHPDEATHIVHGLYFESAAMILVLITLGKTLESYSKGKTTSAIKGLMKLAPQTANVIRDGKEVQIPVGDLKVGDVFTVRPGEHFPADGVIIDGTSTVDESSVTGESMPIDKAPSSEVISGTTNLDGFLTVRAVKVGSDTALGKIIKLVEDASSSKAPIAKTADKVSGIFVPGVIAVAVITFIIWIAVSKDFSVSLTHGISVLVISCPCALGLATPVAIMVGNGKGAKNGILFKNAEALESLGKADAVVLDKTGTITKGKPIVTDTVSFDGYSDTQILKFAVGLENGSEHPIARAIIQKASELGLDTPEVKSFVSLAGHGLQGGIDGHNVLLGNRALMDNYGINGDNAFDAGAKLANQGKTPLYLAVDGKIVGIIAVADEIKPDSTSAIQTLKSMGLRVIMLTGDNALSAQSVANEVGVDAVIADVLPGEKDGVLQALKQYGKIIMVGDGINDAPALTRADVGVAIGAGTDIAIDSADVVLMKSELTDVVHAINLSRRTLTNIKENLFWAFIYNCICIPIAAGALSMPPINITLDPMYGAGAMSLSSVCVVLNALRLNFINLDKNIVRKKQKMELDIEKILTEAHIFSEQNNIKTEGNAECACEIAPKGDKPMVKTIQIEGMMCMHCVAHVQKALSALEGVTVKDVSLENKNAVVEVENVTDETLKNAVVNAGYAVIDIK